ncbi:hypothetical protein [Tardiphaga sp.]|jgi:DNA-directed RNA polymerase specialized sigma24 family protein|uniref:hypothetical protein n=1 Tax=Tardiphaga sp. TaxID=1926292 RepID=UPI0037D9B769
MKRPFKLTDDDNAHVSKLAPSSQALLIAAETDIGGSYAQLSAFFNIPLGTVKSRINRARNKIEALREIAEAA